MSSTTTPINQIQNLITQTRTNYTSSSPFTHNHRLKCLQNLKSMLTTHRDEFYQAMKQDLRQNNFLCSSEIVGSLHEIEYHISHLRQNMKPEKITSANIFTFPGSCEIVREPFGLVLIISPWNYPLSLILKPLAGAIAAGNAVIIKPSEVSANCTALLAKLLPQYLDEKFYRIITGGVPETTEVLKARFDKIFYTGNPHVARIVSRAAAEHLTPVTLELGGKSPCFIDDSVNWSVTIKRLLWGKMLNCSQTCVTPDYILVKKSVRERFVEALKQEIHNFYGDDAQKSSDYSRIISTRHCERLKGIIDEARGSVIHGGRVDVKDLFVEPTLMLNPPLDAKVMQEEIFGPILPIIEVESAEEAIRFINAREKPLALYVFSNRSHIVDQFVRETSSGGFCANDIGVQVVVSELPFGGVGNSGMGGYNGRHTYECFSHRKSVVRKGTWFDSDLRYPPYTQKRVSLLEFANGLPLPNFGKIAKMMVPVVVGVASVAWYYYGHQQ